MVQKYIKIMPMDAISYQLTELSVKRLSID